MDLNESTIDCYSLTIDCYSLTFYHNFEKYLYLND